MRVIVFIFALAGLTNAARQTAQSADGASTSQIIEQLEHERSTAQSAFTLGVDARSHGQRAGP